MYGVYHEGKIIYFDTQEKADRYIEEHVNVNQP